MKKKRERERGKDDSLNGGGIWTFTDHFLARLLIMTLLPSWGWMVAGSRKEPYLEVANHSHYWFSLGALDM